MTSSYYSRWIPSHWLRSNLTIDQRHAAPPDAMQAREVLIKQVQNSIAQAFGHQYHVIDLTFHRAHTVLTKMKVELAIVVSLRIMAYRKILNCCRMVGHQMGLFRLLLLHRKDGCPLYIKRA
jgi:hypothetical protein